MTAVHPILIGEIVAAHGIKGQVRVKTYTGKPEAIGGYSAITDEAGAPVSLKVTSTKNTIAIVTLRGITDRNAAEKLVGKKLYTARAALPETQAGEFYHADLKGLEVRDISGTVLGKIKNMHDFGAGAIMEITLAASGKFEMLPYNPNVVREVNIPGGYIVIEMPEFILVQ